MFFTLIWLTIVHAVKQEEGALDIPGYNTATDTWTPPSLRFGLGNSEVICHVVVKVFNLDVAPHLGRLQSSESRLTRVVHSSNAVLCSHNEIANRVCDARFKCDITNSYLNVPQAMLQRHIAGITWSLLCQRNDGRTYVYLQDAPVTPRPPPNEPQFRTIARCTRRRELHGTHVTLEQTNREITASNGRTREQRAETRRSADEFTEEAVRRVRARTSEIQAPSDSICLDFGPNLGLGLGHGSGD